jgi:hypothetical protein
MFCGDKYTLKKWQYNCKVVASQVQIPNGNRRDKCLLTIEQAGGNHES